MKRFSIVVGMFIATAGLPLTCFTAQAAPLAVDDLPTVETVLSNSVKAVGGREALDKIKTVHTEMQLSMMGQDITTDSSWSRKGGRLAKMKMQMGEMTAGTDGTTGWSTNPMMPGYTISKDPTQLGMASLHMAILDPTTREKEDMKEMKVAAKEKFDGKDCYKLSFVKKTGTPGFVFFDAATGMPAGASQDGGRMKSIVVFSDWKEIQGVKFFHAVNIQAEGEADADKSMGEIKVSKIEINTLEESAFALPDEVKKLAEKQSDSAAAAGPEIKLEDLSKSDQEQAKQMLKSFSGLSAEQLKAMDSQMSMGIDHAPADKKKFMQYVQQEVKKELAKRK